MNDQMGLAEFFAMEAGEYLERLDGLISPSDPPNPDEFVRMARALRGSALMAKQQAIADAAGGLEYVAQAVKEERLAWNVAIKQLCVRAVDDLKILVRTVGEWTPADDTKAQEVAAELAQTAGRRPSASLRAPEGEALDTGTRAFIGREGATVASALDQAAKALQQDPRAHPPLERVLTVMQPLRGLAILTELPPMSDLLDGIERAIGHIIRRAEPTENAALLFHAAAKALSQAAQAIASEGEADPDAEDTQDFTRRLGAILDLEADVPPISAMYFEDAGPHVVEEGTSSARPGGLGRLELVSHGEHLRQAADELEQGRSATQRELRSQALAGTFRALASASDGPLLDAVAEFAAVAHEAVSRRAGVEQTGEFAKQLREAGVALAEAGQTEEHQLVQRLSAIVMALKQLKGAEALPAASATDGALSRPPADSVAIPTPQDLAPRDFERTRLTTSGPSVSPVTPASPTVPEAEETVVAEGASAAEPRPSPPQVDAATAAKETPDIIGSWLRLERLLTSTEPGPASVDELLRSISGARSAPVATPAVAATDAEDAVVSISSLCYTGQAALDRALALRSQVQKARSGGDPNGPVLNDLLEEIFDLVELSRTNNP